MQRLLHNVKKARFSSICVFLVWALSVVFFMDMLGLFSLFAGGTYGGLYLFPGGKEKSFYFTLECLDVLGLILYYI